MWQKIKTALAIAGGDTLEYVFKPNSNYLFTHTPGTSTDMIYGTIMYELALT